jgi:hypothetical protein
LNITNSIATLAKSDPKPPPDQSKKERESPSESKPAAPIAPSLFGINSLESILRGPKKPEQEQADLSSSLWKTNIPTNIGFPILRNYENSWTMIHENNIDLGRYAEVRDPDVTSFARAKVPERLKSY